MLRIAVCDDTASDLRLIVDATQQYLRQRGITAEVREYLHPDALLTDCSKTSIHIFLLDMIMPMVNGIQVGREIRRMNTDAQIIFVTTDPSFALDAYSVNPLHYLVKPVNKDVLFEVLDLAFRKAGHADETTVTLKTHEGLLTLCTDTIVACEYNSHRAIYTLASGTQVETTTFATNFAQHVEQLLKDKRFIQPHVAFVVNMSFVQKLDKGGFTLRNNMFVPISGKQFTAVRNSYLNYRLGGTS